ncbi:class I SAM-dependent methyltransferase [Virgibacillus sp. LDC-1]|uniref:class I SAM-dependent methyltransferase n=1 Tax=Virgibacillus sp. LDC-1 TaxID=3039856 RepID=UPI0024DE03E6|nr:class I SAM-dependent methyltransferase [Virgibacillus sp. LDC-1]
MLKTILDFSHQLIKESVKKEELVVDATCGNGNDTLFLSNTVGENGKVLAFDIQEQAIQATRKLIEENRKNNVMLIHDSHENIGLHLSSHDVIGGAIFNLGYLPKSDKTIITNATSTISAVNAILQHLKINGLIVLVVYHGHVGGKEEKDALLKYVTQLSQKSFHVLQYGYINQSNNPPFIIAIEKRP